MGTSAVTATATPASSKTAVRGRPRLQHRWVLHLLASSDLPQVWRIMRRFGRQIDRQFFLRAAAIPVASLLHAPFATAEALLTRRRVRRQHLAEPLVMIIGHWRSGTTNVHNYFLQDPRFGCVSLLHCMAPHEFLTLRWPARRIARHFVGKQRPMDAVRTGLDEPMSEDFALVGVTDQTHYLGYFFPRLLERTFRETVLFEGVSPDMVERWARDYDWLLKKVTAACQGRPLVLKNPANTGRIRQLVQRYPRMRFVFVHRNPWIVQASTCRLMERFTARWSLQHYDREELERAVLKRHALLLERYFADRSLIPEGQLVEISHEEMVARPVETMQEIYRRLDLGDFEQVRSGMERYARSVADYRTNEYEFDPGAIEAVREALGFTIDAWGHEAPTNQVGGTDPATV